MEKYEAPSNYAGGSPTDAPLQASDYAYDVAIRLNCNVYNTRYESPTDYLPSVFAPNHPVDVRIEKHVIYVSLPEDREVKLGILGVGSSKNRRAQPTASRLVSVPLLCHSAIPGPTTSGRRIAD